MFCLFNTLIQIISEVLVRLLKVTILQGQCQSVFIPHFSTLEFPSHIHMLHPTGNAVCAKDLEIAFIAPEMYLPFFEVEREREG